MSAEATRGRGSKLSPSIQLLPCGRHAPVASEARRLAACPEVALLSLSSVKATMTERRILESLQRAVRARAKQKYVHS
eukprot:5387822-Pleurochrysis_carterae.AAC.1